MAKGGWGRALARAEHELEDIQSGARTLAPTLEALRREAERLKPAYLRHSLARRIEAEVRARGAALMMRDGRKVRTSLLLATATGIIGGLAARDKLTALGTGMSTFDGMLKGLGETRWYILVGRKIMVSPGDGLPAQGTPIAWEEVKAGIARLERKARQGESLGNLARVLSLLADGTQPLALQPQPQQHQHNSLPPSE